MKNIFRKIQILRKLFAKSNKTRGTHVTINVTKTTQRLMQTFKEGLSFHDFEEFRDSEFEINK